MYEKIQIGFEWILSYGITLVEIIGALIVFFYTFKALYFLLRHKHSMSHTMLTEGISTGLSFLLGSEVLKTIIAPDWGSIGMICAILVMRAGMTLLVHWEHRLEKERHPEKED